VSLFAPNTSFAHHGVAGQFDLSKTLKVTGTVTRIRFVNPHSYVYFTVKDAEKGNQDWRCELRSGSLLRRKGWKTDMFKIGSDISIFGSPAREDLNTCYTETITFSDGKKLFRYGAVDKNGNIINDEDAIKASANLEKVSATATSNVPDLSGEWGEPIASGPPAPYGVARPAPFVTTQAAKKLANKWTSEDNPRFQCKTTNIVLDYRFDQMVNKIEQSVTEIKLTYGFMDLKRTIHLEGTFPTKITPSIEGYSVGKWEDGKLVVHTKGFKPGFLEVIGGLTRSSVPSSDQMEVKEVFYIDDKNELIREYTITDPVYLAKPHSHLNKSVKMDGQYIPFGCDDLTEEDKFTKS
jgi:hypothetical protein